MNNLKKIIIIVVIIIILITIALFVVKYLDKKDKQENFENTITMDIANTISLIDNRNEFFAVKSCVTKYLTYIAQEDKEMVYSMLDKNYIEEYNITQETALSNISKYTNPVFYNDKIYVIQDTIEVYTYFVYGKVIDKETGDISEFNVVVRLDKGNDLFSIIPYKYIEDKQYSIVEGNSIVFEYNEIENNTYNTFAFKNITDEEMSVFYMNEIKDNFVYDLEASYYKLDETYRNKRFLNLEEYEKYITKNISNLYSAKLQKFQINEYTNYNQYVLIDQNEKYYIVNETHPGEYTIILDTYTIDLPEYLEKYNNANDQQKVAYCINRFMQAVNDENYTFAYSLLASGFKDNYFKNQESFENYAKQNLLSKDNISFGKFSNEGNIYYTYEVTLANGDEDSNTLEKTFIVKLGEGTNFELSFNID